MQLDGPVSDGKSQAHAAAGPLAGFADAIKRLKDVLQFRFGYARPMVANSHHSGIKPGG